eukprot:TRINITY_DN188_c0_g1_i1.p1 TRINITY_DN188_c0_g1~~TRINITY_DN188_c0_g1_i1.p1  ORF type:complete len:1401 (+),score=495.58 TRINITY_DN188_c0_g1_i1:88-4203(+)
MAEKEGAKGGGKGDAPPDGGELGAEQLAELKGAELAAQAAGQRRRRATREENVGRSKGLEPKKLKSDLKRSGALVKRLKAFSADDLSGVMAQVKSLNLTRYVSEIVQALLQAVTDGKLKAGDAGAAAEVCGLLHQTYAEFGPDLVSSLQGSLDTSPLGPAAAQESGPPVTAARATARLLLELFALGVHQDAGAAVHCVHAVCNPTPAGGKPPPQPPAPTERMLTLANQLLKWYGEELFGVRSAAVAAMLPEDAPGPQTKEQVAQWAAARAGADLAAEQGGESPVLLPGAAREEVVKHLTGLLDRAVEAFNAQVGELEEQWRENAKVIADRGELPEERKQGFQDAKLKADKFRASVAQLADLLGTPERAPPELDMSQFTSGETNTSITFMSGLAAFYAPVEEFGTASLFDDEEQRAFYEDITDISENLPEWVLNIGLRRALLRGARSGDGGGEAGGEEEGAEGDAAAAGERAVRFTADTEDGKKGRPKRAGRPDEPEDGKKEKEKEKRPSDFTAVDALLRALPDRLQAGTKAATDEWIADFVSECYPPPLPPPPPADGAEEPASPQGPPQWDADSVQFANNFAVQARKRLIVAMLRAPRMMLNLLPHFARITATMAEWWRDFGPNISSTLEDDFEKALEKQSQTHIESRCRNIRFIGELVKAKIVQPSRVLTFLAQLLDNFVHHNIQVACNLLESCGRYLNRSQLTSVRLQNLIQHMRRRQQERAMDHQYEAMIDAAIQEAKPPEQDPHAKKQQKKHKVRGPVELYVRKMVFEVLNNDPQVIRKVVRAIRKLDWQDPRTAAWVSRTLRKVHRVQADNIPALATVVASVHKHRPEVAIRVIDLLLEQVRLCLEICPPALDGAPQPVKQQRRLLDLQYFAELYIYRLVDDGIVFDLLYTIIFYAGWNDAPDDYFRIRMVCTLLEAVAPYSSKLKQGRRKLFRFLPCFFCYVHRKAKPFPIDLEYAIADLMEVIGDVAGEKSARQYSTFPPTAKEAHRLMDHLESVLLGDAGGPGPAPRGRVRGFDPAGGKNAALYHFIRSLRDAPGNPGAPHAEGGRRKHGLLSNNVVPFRNKVHPIKDAGGEEFEDSEDDDEEEAATDQPRRAVHDDDPTPPVPQQSAEPTPQSPAEPGAGAGAGDVDYVRDGKFLVPGGSLFARPGREGKGKQQPKEDDEFLAMFASTVKESLSQAKHEAAMRQMRDGGKARAEEKMASTMNMPVSLVRRAGNEERTKRASQEPAAAPASGDAPRTAFTIVLRRKGQQSEEVCQTKVAGKSMVLATINVPEESDLVARQQDHRQRKEEEDAETLRRTMQLVQAQQAEQAEAGQEDDIGPLTQQAAVPRKGGKGGGARRQPQRPAHTQTTLGQHRQQKDKARQ